MRFALFKMMMNATGKAQEPNATILESYESINRGEAHGTQLQYCKTRGRSNSSVRLLPPNIQNPIGGRQARQLPQTNLPTEHRQPLRNKVRPIKHRRVSSRKPYQVCGHHTQHPVTIKHGKNRKCYKHPPQADY